MPRAKVTVELAFDPADETENYADVLGELLKLAHVQRVPVEVKVPEAMPARDPPPDDDPLLGGGGGTDGKNPPPAPDTGGSTKRVRDRTAERRAAKEKAEADAKAAQTAKTNGGAAPPAEDDPLMGGDDSAPIGADPFDEPIPAADAPPKPARTPQQLMDASIIILRQCYGVAGGIDQVKVVQKEFKVSQFTQVPLEKAGVLYNRALALAQTLNVNLPPGV